MLTTGRVIAGYRLEAVLGQGGMSVVYEATQLSLRRTVALKVISDALGRDPAFRERFRQEGRIHSGLDHPHIVPVYEAGETEEELFLAMRLVRGANLKELIQAGQLDPARMLRILAPVADALDDAHEAGVIHRDVKPQNILVGARDHAYLADFGLTRSVGTTSMTQPGGFIGTFDYVSPEQISGEPASPSSDIYALAAVLYECLTGSVPFPRATDAALLFAHVSAPPPRVSERRPDLPAAVDAVIERALAKDPAARHASAGEMVLDIRRALGAAAYRASPPPRARSAPEQATRVSAAPAQPRTGRGARIAAGAALVGAAAAVAFLIGHSGEPDPPAPPVTVAGDGVRITVPPGWRRGEAPIIPGLDLAGPVALTMDGTPAAGLVAGRLPGVSGPMLLPARFTNRLGAPPPQERVRLLWTSSLRYADLRPTGFDRPVTMYVAPLRHGAAIVACFAPERAPRTFGAGCARAAASLWVTDGVPIAVEPSRELAGRIEALVSDLESARTDAERDLRRARTRRGQARALGRLAAAYHSAAGDAAGIEAGPAERDAVAGLARALRRARSAYLAAERDAHRGRRAAYAAARARARRADGALRAALTRLEDAGYRLG